MTQIKQFSNESISTLASDVEEFINEKKKNRLPTGLQLLVAANASGFLKNIVLLEYETAESEAKKEVLYMITKDEGVFEQFLQESRKVSGSIETLLSSHAVMMSGHGAMTQVSIIYRESLPKTKLKLPGQE